MLEVNGRQTPLAQNGLSVNGRYVELGGPLKKATNIAQAGFDLGFAGGKFGIGIAVPGFPCHVQWSNVADTIGAVFETTTGRRVFLDNNTTVGAYNSIVGNADIALLFSDSGNGANSFANLIVGPHTNGGAYGLKVGATGQNGFNTVSPLAILQIGASDGSTNKGPLKFTVPTSVLVASPEQGLMEVDNAGALYYTPVAVRKTVAFTDSIFSGATTTTDFEFLTASNGIILKEAGGRRARVSLVVVAGNLTLQLTEL